MDQSNVDFGELPIMKGPSFLRASGWIQPSNIPDCLNIIGCGAVGSNAAILAAKMGFTRFQIWDDDIVQDYNLPNQAYLPEDIDIPKVDALEKALVQFNPNIIVTKHNRRFTSDLDKDLLVGPVLIATDSISSRKDITTAFKFNLNIPLVVEARLIFDAAQIHIVHPTEYSSIQRWERTLHRTDEEVEEGPCNLRLCSTLVYSVIGVLVHQLCIPYGERRVGDEPIPKRINFSIGNTLKVMTEKER